MKLDFGMFGACLLCLDNEFVLLLLLCYLRFVSFFAVLFFVSCFCSFGFVWFRSASIVGPLNNYYPHRVGLLSVLYVYYYFVRGKQLTTVLYLVRELCTSYEYTDGGKHDKINAPCKEKINAPSCKEKINAPPSPIHPPCQALL